MLPNLRSVIIAQVTRGGRSAVPRRNFSSSNRRNFSPSNRRNFSPSNRRNFSPSNESKGAGMLSRVIGVTLGAYLGHYITKDTIPRMEQDRQELDRMYFGDSEPIFDLREMMWSEPIDDLWSDLKVMRSLLNEARSARKS